MKLSILSQKTRPHGHKTRGQALVEFTLILPLLLLILLGIIDYGRILFIYSSISSAIRDAARNAEILGADENGDPSYASCNLILEDATNTFLQNVATSDINVLYYSTGKKEDVNQLTEMKFYNEWIFLEPAELAAAAAAESITPPSNNWEELADYDCDNTTPNTAPLFVTNNSEKINTGDIMVVTITTDVVFITPILSSIVDKFTINFRAQRSVVTNLIIEKKETDTDGDGLDDDWEFFEWGCMASADKLGNDKYEGLVIRPTGLIINPLTHDYWEENVGDGETHVSSLIAYPSPDATSFKYWAQQACLMEDRDPAIYPDADNGWTYEDVGCILTPDPDVISCPVPALEEFNAADDPDGDGCNNGCEETTGGEPIEGLAGVVSTDTDGDGLLDGEEVHKHGTDPTNPDTDGDGLLDGEEVHTYHTSPKKGDTDGDGLNDYEEATYMIDGDSLIFSNADEEYFLDENNNIVTDENGDPVADTTKLGGNDTDADDDGIDDYAEVVLGYNLTMQINGSFETLSGTTNPMKSDTDGDGISDKAEIDGFWIGAVFVYLDPNNDDTDGDGISDGDEKAIWDALVAAGKDASDPSFSSPFTTDTDGDGLKDGVEVSIADGGYGTDPNDSNSDNQFEGCKGSDGTGTYYLDDEDESIGPLVIAAGNNLDPDGDGIANGKDGNSDDTTGGSEITDSGVELTDCVEVHQYSTNPYKWDTDGDGVSDLDEINCAVLSPLLKDSDGDGVDDTQADADSCDNTDSDGDSLGDIWEGEFGFGCVYTVGGANLLNPDGLAFSVSGGIATYVGTATYPDDCDGYGAGTDEYYLGFGASDDPDQDGCDNTCELNRHTDPLDSDTDNDFLLDGDEITTSPLLADTDGDTLLDGEEANPSHTTYYGSDPLDKDSDNDGLEDGDEVAVGTALSNVDCDVDGDGTAYPTDTNDAVLNATPAICDGLNGILDSDTDGDGLLDGLEVNTYLTSPILYDSDDDGLSDFDELFIYDTYPKLADTDGDTLIDGDEINFYLTNAKDEDTDNDNLTDGEEVNGFDMTIVLTNGGTVTSTTVVSIPGYDPDNPPTDGVPATYTLNPSDGDSDNDGWNDGFEVYLQGEVDGLGNPVKNGTNPIVPDTDGDGTNDGLDGEPLDGTDIGDSDGDGLIDDDEINIWLTDPNDPDTDDDGLGDKFETSAPIDVKYYSSDYITGDPDGTYTGNIILEGYSFDTDSDGLGDSFELYLYEIITGGSVPADVQTVIDDILADADATNDTLVQCLYYTDNALTPDPANGLHPGVYDTDGDGLGDGDECNVYLTDPLDATDQNVIITSKIPNQSFRDLVYAALEKQYDLIAIIAAGDLDAEGRYPIAIVRYYDGSDYVDVTSTITGACGTTSTFDGSNFTEHTNVCGILDTNYNNNTTDQVWYAWVAPSAIYDLIQDTGIVIVNPNN